MREHNSRCDELFQRNKNKMTDEDYFQEARRWWDYCDHPKNYLS